MGAYRRPAELRNTHVVNDIDDIHCLWHEAYSQPLTSAQSWNARVTTIQFLLQAYSLTVQADLHQTLPTYR